MTPPDVRLTVTLAVRPAEGGGFTADVVFASEGTDPAPLYLPMVFEGGRIESDVFVITVGDRKAKYTGVYAKRPAPRPDEFRMLAPGEEARYAVRLDEAYAIPDAPGRRHAVYEAFTGDVTLFGRLWKLRSNEVAF